MFLLTRLLSCLLLVGIVSAEASAQRDQSIPITVTTNTGAVNVLVLRLCSNSIELISFVDTCDRLMPPVPPSSVYDVRLVNPDLASEFDAQIDARPLPTSSSAIYNFDLQYQLGASTNDPLEQINLSWNPDDIDAIPEIDSITITDNVSELLFGPVDMENTDQLTLNSKDQTWGITGLRIKLTFRQADFILDAKVFLSGAFVGSEMRNDLVITGVLESEAMVQPFSAAPWSYSGLERVSSGFYGDHMDTVDWVYIQLFSGDHLNPPLIFETETAALLRGDGRIISPLDGEAEIDFFHTPGSYYVQLDHRNHLSILSANPIDFNTGSASYDFTTGLSTTYSNGAPAQTEVSAGVYAMWGGDGNASFDVTAFDFLNSWLLENGSDLGYKSGDFNLDGSITAFDFLNVWLVANGFQAQLP